MKKKEAAGFILYRIQKEEPEFLLLKNARHGEWGFPKGHRDKADKDLLACAMRELREETGLEHALVHGAFREVITYVIEAEVSRKGTAYTKDVTYFLAQIDESRGSAEIALSIEHSDIAWMSEGSALEALNHDDLRRVLTKAAIFLRP